MEKDKSISVVPFSFPHSLSHLLHTITHTYIFVHTHLHSHTQVFFNSSLLGPSWPQSVRWYYPSLRSKPSASIVINNLPLAISVNRLKFIFSELGQIVSLKIVKNLEGKSSGVGIVSFGSDKDAEKAVRSQSWLPRKMRADIKIERMTDYQVWRDSSVCFVFSLIELFSFFFFLFCVCSLVDWDLRWLLCDKAPIEDAEEVGLNPFLVNRADNFSDKPIVAKVIHTRIVTLLCVSLIIYSCPFIQIEPGVSHEISFYGSSRPLRSEEIRNVSHNPTLQFRLSDSEATEKSSKFALPPSPIQNNKYASLRLQLVFCVWCRSFRCVLHFHEFKWNFFLPMFCSEHFAYLFFWTNLFVTFVFHLFFAFPAPMASGSSSTSTVSLTPSAIGRFIYISTIFLLSLFF